MPNISVDPPIPRPSPKRAWLLAIFPLVTLALAIASQIDGGTSAFDHHLLTAMRLPGDLSVPIGPHWLRESMIDITALGGTTVLTLISVTAIAFLLLLRRYREAVFATLATGGGAIGNYLLKASFARERPEVVPHLIEVGSLSFPSSHALNSVVVFLTLGILLARTTARWPLRLFIVGVAALFALLIGFSRIYLGVHFPSDVLAGWSLGAAWVLALYALFHGRLHHRTGSSTANRPLGGGP